MNAVRLCVIGLFFYLMASCQNSKKHDSEPLFSLLSPAQTNISFINKLENKRLNILEYLYYYNGGGVAGGDINNDGLVDLYFTSNEGENKLYLNKGNLQFEDITSSAGVGCADEWSTGVALVDINNDGLLDLYVCQVGNYKGLKGTNRLFVNNGNLTFTDRAAEYGLDFSGFSTQAAFFDFDQDDDLDMYLLNHSVHSTRSYGPSSLRMEWDAFAGDRLFLNQSEKGEKRFKEVSRERGIYNSHIGYGLGLAISDVNNDGWPDIYVSNDFHENDYLYINKKDGTFKESLEEMIGHTSRYSMGNDIGDLNGDAMPDIVTTDMLPYSPEIILKSAWEDTQEVSDIKKGFGYADQNVRNMLQVNRGDHFSEVGQFAGIDATDWSWSPLIADFNNDSYADVFVSNGIYKRPNDLDYIQYTSDISKGKFTGNQAAQDAEMIKRMPTLQIPNFLFVNRGNLTFENKASEFGLAQPSYSNGAAYADLDNDGDLDLIVNNVNQQAFIYRNNTIEKQLGNFLTISLKRQNYKSAIGSKVKVYAGGRVWLREQFLSRGFQSSVAPAMHVGLGEITQIDSIEIFWKHNQRQVIKDAVVNKLFEITETSDADFIPADKGIKNNLFASVSLPESIRHKENSYKDYSVEPLLPYRLSQEGPALAVADVNQDGLQDFYLGGSKGQAAQLIIQYAEGKFQVRNVKDFLTDSVYEDTDAVFFDANSDNFPDLYVVSGGGEFPEGHDLYLDRLYVNDGKGNFVRSVSLLPDIKSNGSCARVFDFNSDGADDIFIGVRSVPGIYGKSPGSYFLLNNGNGSFQLYQTMEMGMITDAEWTDLNHDGKYELLVVGDWMAPSVYKLNANGFEADSAFSSMSRFSGWWRSVKVADINGDGMVDILAGNMGKNLRIKPTEENSLTLFLNDFDDNGQQDPVMFYWLNEKNIPFHTKSQLARQMPMLNKKFNNYQSFSKIAHPQDLLPAEKLDASSKVHATHFENSVFINRGNNQFHLLEMPTELQFSNINDWLVYDFNKDSIADIFCAGNNKSNLIQLGNQDAQSKLLLLGKGNDKFEAVQINNVHDFNKEVKSIQLLRGRKQEYFIFGVKSGAPEIITLHSD